MRTHRLVAALATFGAISAAIACSPSSESCGPRAVCSWPVATGEVEAFRGPELVPAREIAFVEFPADARQGGRTWYRLDLELSFTLDWDVAGLAGAPAFPAYLSLAVDGDVAFQLKLGDSSHPDARCDPRQGQPAPEWSTVGLVSGAQRGRIACEGPTRLAFANYLQARSVHPGRAPVTLELRGPFPASIDGVRVGPGSRIWVTPEGPPDVEMRSRVRDVAVEGTSASATLEVAVEVDDQPAKQANLSVYLLDGSGRAEQEFWPEGGPALYTVRVTWEGAPSAVFLLSAATGVGSDAQFVEVAASGDGEPAIAIPAIAGLVAATAIVAAFATAIRSHRRLRR